MSTAAAETRVRYEPVIGLEVHAQLATRTKLFCGCSTEFGRPANTNICPVCIGLPGALPVINRKAVEYGVRLALATACRVQDRSYFARKNYFYPDLPKGYQISQFDRPYAEGGHVEVEVGGETRRIRLTRIHLEEDAGKSLHDGFPDSDRFTYLDFNRAGVPLCEIVSEPDIRSSEEAAAYLVRLRSILTYLGVCDGNMEEGSMRCDANVSLRPVGETKLGTRTELKNLNSFRNVQRAIDFEIARQEDVLRDGGSVVQETRLFDADRGVTESMRSKEESHDYRYFPEPDLQPLEIRPEVVEATAATLPEMPGERRKRFMDVLGLPEATAEFLTLERPLADYFEAVAEASGDARAAANWVSGELTRVLNQKKLDIADSPVPAADLGRLIKMIDKGTVSGKMAKEVFGAMVDGEGDPEAIVSDRGLSVISDESQLGSVIDTILADSPAQVEQFRAGKEKVFGYFVGQVMKATKGQASPEVVSRLLRAALSTE